MRTFHWFLPITLATFLGGVVTAQQPQQAAGNPPPMPCDLAPAKAMPPTPEGQTPAGGMSPKTKIKDIMNSMMVPSSNAVWNAVATSTDATGVHESKPQTDDDWNNLYFSAVELTEVANL